MINQDLEDIAMEEKENPTVEDKLTELKEELLKASQNVENAKAMYLRIEGAIMVLEELK